MTDRAQPRQPAHSHSYPHPHPHPHPYSPSSSQNPSHSFSLSSAHTSAHRPSPHPQSSTSSAHTVHTTEALPRGQADNSPLGGNEARLLAHGHPHPHADMVIRSASDGNLGGTAAAAASDHRSHQHHPQREPKQASASPTMPERQLPDGVPDEGEDVDDYNLEAQFRGMSVDPRYSYGQSDGHLPHQRYPGQPQQQQQQQHHQHHQHHQQQQPYPSHGPPGDFSPYTPHQDYSPYAPSHPHFGHSYVTPPSSGFNQPYHHQHPQGPQYQHEYPPEAIHPGQSQYGAMHPQASRSSQTSPLNPSPPYPHQLPNYHPHSRPNTAQTQATYAPSWGSPPMSPILGPGQVPYGPVGDVGAGHSRHGSFMEDYGAGRGMMFGSAPPSAWNSPAGHNQYAFYPAPYPGAGGMTMDGPPRAGPSDWSGAGPAPGAWQQQQQQQQRGSWNGPPRGNKQPNRMSWSGPSRPSFSQAINQEPIREGSSPEKEKERRPYHPQPPARRSDWVMWVGNVPNNTSHEELWRYFNSTVPTRTDEPEDADPWRGPSSIFLISRSSCAFVNLSSELDLERAVAFFNNRSLRPFDPYCPRMVCRIRRKDDDLRAGVGAQRGTGMHRTWIKEQEERKKAEGPPTNVPLPQPIEVQKASDTLASAPQSASSMEPPSPAIFEHPPEGEGRRRDSIVQANDDQAALTKHRSSASYASTNSSFLAKHFPKRYFILKSLTTVELEESYRRGTWKTQHHNEGILDQAFRNSQEVILIFGANRSGEFFGYARMIEPIDKEKAAQHAASRSVSLQSKLSSSSHSGSLSGGSGPSLKTKSQPQPARIKEEDEEERTRAGSDPPARPSYFLSPSQQRIASSSPGEFSPGEEVKLQTELAKRNTDPTRYDKRAADANLSAPAASDGAGGARAQTLDPKALPNPYFPPVPISGSGGFEEAGRQEALGGSHKPQIKGDDGVLRKDTILTPNEKAQRDLSLPQPHGPIPHPDRPEDEFSPEGWGKPFRVEWIKATPLPFSRTRHLRNPWNQDREVKVCRDGTEVEPNVGAQLIAEWEKLDAQSAPRAPYPSSTAATSPPRPLYSNVHRYAAV